MESFGGAGLVVRNHPENITQQCPSPCKYDPILIRMHVAAVAANRGGDTWACVIRRGAIVVNLNHGVVGGMYRVPGVYRSSGCDSGPCGCRHRGRGCDRDDGVGLDGVRRGCNNPQHSPQFPIALLRNTFSPPPWPKQPTTCCIRRPTCIRRMRPSHAPARMPHAQCTMPDDAREGFLAGAVLGSNPQSLRSVRSPSPPPGVA